MIHHRHRKRKQQQKKLMPKKLPPKNKTWVQLTKDFVKEWPEVLEGLHFQNLPVKYLKYVNIILKNNITIHYDISTDLKTKKQDTIARFLKKVLEENYRKIESVDLKFDVTSLKKDMENKTSFLLNRTFKSTRK
jgi:hypothetical protein